MDFEFKVKKFDKKSFARGGVIKTPHGDIETPAFSPVGTKATVKSLDPVDLKNIKTQVVLGNAYHLYLKPGIETIENFGGFAPFMGWNGPAITDSGGYQVSFLWNRKVRVKPKSKISDFGMYFYSHIDGSKHFLTPELSMKIQSVLGADIIMSLDQPMGYEYTKKENAEAFKRSLKWEEQSFRFWEKSRKKSKYGKYQALFGIIQGQLDKKLRNECLKFIIRMGFPGIAIGDETIGSDPKITAKSLDTIAGNIPDDKPLHALGLGGGPEGVFEAVKRGVDIFDNSSVTRMARTGLLFIFPEDGGSVENKFRINIKNSSFRNDKKPVSSSCSCYTCKTFSKAYINHLLTSDEILGSRLATIHNIYFYNNLMYKIRVALDAGDFLDLMKLWLKKI
ncbi:MAG TPA: tRNA guanosine(34) transglycosylase Tgt [Patescibacteria group bacterium]|nr:tRNA guanosine(34) transglycosylase Tgt [Patescibacteria group bacterium]